MLFRSHFDRLGSCWTPRINSTCPHVCCCWLQSWPAVAFCSHWGHADDRWYSNSSRGTRRGGANSCNRRTGGFRQTVALGRVFVRFGGSLTHPGRDFALTEYRILTTALGTPSTSWTCILWTRLCLSDTRLSSTQMPAEMLLRQSPHFLTQHMPRPRFNKP